MDSVHYEICGTRDPSEPRPEPPAGVTVLRAKTTIGLDGVDQFVLSVAAEAGKVTLTILATWLWDTFRARKADKRSAPPSDAETEPGGAGHQVVNVTINGNVYVIDDALGLERALVASSKPG
jgi:hypothetical protein